MVIKRSFPVSGSTTDVFGRGGGGFGGFGGLIIGSLPGSRTVSRSGQLSTFPGSAGLGSVVGRHVERIAKETLVQKVIAPAKKPTRLPPKVRTGAAVSATSRPSAPKKADVSGDIKMGVITDFFGDVVSGVTQYQIAKATRPDNPFIPNILEYGMAGPPAVTAAEVVIDNATGQVIDMKPCRKSRRRRRRLATASDLKDLAALKAILGGGKSLDTWLATRGRR